MYSSGPGSSRNFGVFEVGLSNIEGVEKVDLLLRVDWPNDIADSLYSDLTSGISPGLS